MRRPTRLPKITKYSVVVTAEGTSVWPQMRMMRPNSRVMIVRKPTHSRYERDGATVSSFIASPPARRDCRWRRRPPR